MLAIQTGKKEKHSGGRRIGNATSGGEGSRMVRGGLTGKVTYGKRLEGSKRPKRAMTGVRVIQAMGGRARV